jgi:hypothetical protein
MPINNNIALCCCAAKSDFQLMEPAFGHSQDFLIISAATQPSRTNLDQNSFFLALFAGFDEQLEVKGVPPEPEAHKWSQKSVFFSGACGVKIF